MDIYGIGNGVFSLTPFGCKPVSEDELVSVVASQITHVAPFVDRGCVGSQIFFTGGSSMAVGEKVSVIEKLLRDSFSHKQGVFNLDTVIKCDDVNKHLIDEIARSFATSDWRISQPLTDGKSNETNMALANQLLFNDPETGEELRPVQAPTATPNGLEIIAINKDETRSWRHLIKTEEVMFEWPRLLKSNETPNAYPLHELLAQLKHELHFAQIAGIGYVKSAFVIKKTTLEEPFNPVSWPSLEQACQITNIEKIICLLEDAEKLALNIPDVFIGAIPND